MKTYKVSYFVDDKTVEKEIRADRAGITPDGHLVFERVTKIGELNAKIEEAQFIAAFAAGFWLKFIEVETDKANANEHVVEESVKLPPIPDIDTSPIEERSDS